MEDKPNLKSKAWWGAALLGLAGVLTVGGNYLAGNIDLGVAIPGFLAAVGTFLGVFGIRDKLNSL